MPLSVDQLASCMSWAAKQGLAEVTLTIGSSRVTILRNGPDCGTAGPLAAPVTSDSPSASAPSAQQETGQITASLAGLCHLAPDPGSKPFVSIGDRVAAGQTLCLLEAMKMMTPITAPQAGTVEAILVEDGRAVDAGAPLMRISA